MKSFKAEAITKLAKKLSALLEENAFDEPDGQVEGFYTTEERAIMDCIITICNIPEDPPYNHDKISGKYAWETVQNLKDIPFYDLLARLSDKDETLRTFNPKLEYSRKEGVKKMARSDVLHIIASIEYLINGMIWDNASDEDLVDILKVYLVAADTNADDLDLMGALKDFEVHVLDDWSVKIG